MPALESPIFRLAHISDLHFFKLQWNPIQFFSKRWLGNLNLLFHRKNALEPEALTTLFPVFHERKVDAVLITGDLTTTTHEDELLLAKRFVDCLKGENLKVFTLPGNHDHYTKKAFRRKSFYQFFDEFYAPGLSLKEDQLTAAYFEHGWWLMALDTAVATSWVSSNGYFSPELEQRLEKALQEIPDDHRVILLNHFPIFSNESPRKWLIRKEALKKLIQRFPKIKLFLHGHTHRHSIADLRNSGLPIILDSGSTAKKQGGTWNLIDITTAGCEIEVFKNSTQDGFWQPISKTGFKW